MAEIAKKSLSVPARAFSFNQWLKEGGSTTMRSYAFHEAYRRVSWVFACVNITAATASSAPLVFYDGPTQSITNRINDPNHPVNRLFASPKEPEIHSLRELLYRTFVYKNIVGGVWWVFQVKRGQIVSVEPRLGLRPLLSKGSMGELQGWEGIDNEGEIVQYPVDRVLPIGYFNPMDPYQPLSPLSAARLSVEFEYNIAGWNTGFFKTGMKNPILLQSKGTLTKDQKREIKKEVVDYYSGIEGAHGALLLQGNIDVTSLNINPKDYDFIQGKKLNREEIASIFGVPPSLIGIMDRASFANIREQRKIFWENTLLPSMNQIRDLIQTFMLDKRFKGITCGWDTSKIIGLKDEGKDVATAAKTYFDMGYTLEQISVILNVPELNPEYNEPVSGASSTPVQQEESATISVQKSKRTDVEWVRLNEDSHRALIIDNIAKLAIRLEDYGDYVYEFKNESRKRVIFDQMIGKELNRIVRHAVYNSLIIVNSLDEEYDSVKLTELMYNRIKVQVEDGISNKLDLVKNILFLDHSTDIIEGMLRYVINTAIHKTYQCVGVKEIEWVGFCFCHTQLSGIKTNPQHKFYALDCYYPMDNLQLDGDCKCIIIPKKLD